MTPLSTIEEEKELIFRQSHIQTITVTDRHTSISRPTKRPTNIYRLVRKAHKHTQTHTQAQRQRHRNRQAGTETGAHIDGSRHCVKTRNGFALLTE